MNKSVLDYLVTHCQLHQHFLTLKRFLLLEDGEFGHSLSTQLSQQLSFGKDWRLLCSPSFLNPLLLSALEASLNSNSSFANKLSFALKYQPHTVHVNGKSTNMYKFSFPSCLCLAVKALDFLQLKYKVWFCSAKCKLHYDMWCFCR